MLLYVSRFIVFLLLRTILYHNLFSHSPVDGHLGCFQFLASLNKVAMNNIHV